jgi:hypothetical protein
MAARTRNHPGERRRVRGRLSARLGAFCHPDQRGTQPPNRDRPAADEVMRSRPENSVEKGDLLAPFIGLVSGVVISLVAWTLLGAAILIAY